MVMGLWLGFGEFIFRPLCILNMTINQIKRLFGSSSDVAPFIYYFVALGSFLFTPIAGYIWLVTHDHPIQRHYDLEAQL
jgi:hypothetical protein